MAGRAEIGWSDSPGGYEGFRLLVATDPTGVVTGFGFCRASTADQQVAESFFAIRHRPNPRLLSVGSDFSGSLHGLRKGFEGEENHRRRWLDRYGVQSHPPAQAQSSLKWSSGPSP
jgi:hypothetical protein